MIHLARRSFLRQAWTNERQRVFYARRMNYSIQSRNAASPVYSQPKHKSDNHLCLVFDDQQMWKQLSNNSTTESIGVCGHPHFSDIHGIQFAAQQAIQRSQILVERICNAPSNGAEEMRKVVKQLDRLSDTLCSVIDVAEFVRHAHPDNNIRESVHQAYSQLYSYMNVLNTDTRLHKVLSQALADEQIVKHFTADEYMSAIVLLHDFEKSGIHLPIQKRKKFVDLSDRIIHLGREFMQQNPRAIREVKIPLTALGRLHLSDSSVTIKNGYAHIPTDSSEAQLILKYANNEQLRKQIYESVHTATKESIAVLEQMLKTRAELAVLVGKSSFAELQLQDRMAKSPEHVEAFLRKLSEHQGSLFKRDMQLLQYAKQRELNLATAPVVNAWDRDYYMHLCGVEEAQNGSINHHLPYFTVGSVIRGLSRLFDSLYGVRFEYAPMRSGESWHDQVRKLNVVCENEGKIGVIYCDLFSRAGKPPGAAHYTIRTSRRVDDDDSENDIRFAFPNRNVDEANFLPPIVQPAERVQGRDGLYQLPVIALSCSFSLKSRNQPAYLSMYEIETLFHEMGHAMHSMLGRTDFHNVAGTRCATDFVELPSILMEHFIWHPKVLSLFMDDPNTAVGSPASIESFLKQRKSFNGIELNSQILMALVDQRYHSSIAKSDSFSSVKEWHQLQDSVGLFPSVASAMWPVQFHHLFGYAANYYSYLFDRALARKVWETNFKENPLDRENGQAFRKSVLEWGGSRDPWKCIADVLEEEDASKIVNGDEVAMKAVGDWGVDV